ncbi:glycosyltransferase [Hydrogenophaga aromaticivorans]|uniref:glycosyltransferase n=1 Tax=Hydrogenophaga aromaticivorans TaxID=2610898 RepID=UPI001B36FAC7|nr:glycosyltransferase [Hydrogenophaga aromaticivorans]MBQ0918450.1 glycosyltransferase [Hydrogenophaga aromaticivorans]
MKRAFATVAGGAQVATASHWLHQLRGQQPEADRFFLLCLDTPAVPVSTDPAIRTLSLSDLPLPDHNIWPFDHAFADPGQALGPWLVQHLFQAGFDQVLCFHPALLPATIWPPVEDLLTLLDPDTDVVLGHGPEARHWPAWLAQNTPRAQSILRAWQDHLQRAAQLALDGGWLAQACVLPALAQDEHRAVVWGPAWPGLNLEVPIQAPGLRRLHALFHGMLQRAPDRAALVDLLPLMNHRTGLLRVALALARSAEARALSPGIAQRLVRALRPLAGGSAWDDPPALALALAPLPEPDTPLARTRSAPVSRPSALPCPQGLNLIGYIKAELGVGEAARSLARACQAADIAYSTFDVGHQSQNLQRDDSIVAQASPRHYAIDLLYVNPSHTAATVEHLREQGKSRGAYAIGFWHWEQPELPPHFHGAFAHVDEVWVPSTFVQDAVADVAPVPVFKVPHAVSFTPSSQVSRRTFGLPEGRKLVLVMYDFMSSQHRKNPQAAVAAFRIAARRQPELGLVIKTLNSEHHPQALAELLDSVADLPHVTFINHFLTRQGSWDLMSCCDILLSLHRAEGFGLAPAEMMSLGKPVVATGWSANMDFMTTDNSLPVRYTLRPLEHDLAAYPAGPLWAEADVEHAAHCLEDLATDAPLAQRLGQRAALDIRQQLSPQVVGARIRQRLQMLGHWHPELHAFAYKALPHR